MESKSELRYFSVNQIKYNRKQILQCMAHEIIYALHVFFIHE